LILLNDNIVLFEIYCNNYVNNLYIYIMLINYYNKYKKYKAKYLRIRLHNMIGGYEMDAAEAMYMMDGLSTPIFLYIPEEDFTNNGNDISIHDILIKYNINPDILSDTLQDTHLEVGWVQSFIKSLGETKSIRNILLEYSRKNKTTYENTDKLNAYEKYTHVKNFQKLFLYAKEILKTFLPTDDMLLNYRDKKKYHFKGDELQKRMFSFYYLRQVVNSNKQKFNKIKFPTRSMIIMHNEKLLSREEIVEYIENNFKFVIDKQGHIRSELLNPNYKIIICSQFIEPNMNIDKLAKEQIKQLCQIAPFDTSANTGGNMFGIGDEVWIVDGKNKDTGNVSNCITHLNIEQNV